MIARDTGGVSCCGEPTAPSQGVNRTGRPPGHMAHGFPCRSHSGVFPEAPEPADTRSGSRLIRALLGAPTSLLGSEEGALHGKAQPRPHPGSRGRLQAHGVGGTFGVPSTRAQMGGKQPCPWVWCAQGPCQRLPTLESGSRPLLHSREHMPVPSLARLYISKLLSCDPKHRGFLIHKQSCSPPWRESNT